MSSRRQNLRKRNDSASESDSEADEMDLPASDNVCPMPTSSDVAGTVSNIRELQKLRTRPKGVSVASLALGKKITTKAEAVTDDPYKMQTGGLVEMKKILKRKISEDEDEQTINKLFAAETNKRDEDADMLKYIEENLAAKRGSEKKVSPEKNKDKEKDVIAQVPEELRPTLNQKSEGMMSQQMLCGIPEVDLGIQAKMRNIEATEEAKQRLLRERMEAKMRGSEVSEFVPTNVAVNFVQHSRWNNSLEIPARREPQKSEAAAGGGDKPDKPKQTFRVGDYERLATLEDEARGIQTAKATDTYHLQKFVQNMRGKRK